ncbi:MAG: transposase [Candidatus Electryonea clarkiae]|nr:transposase [Candidatus Electryonea clarkiae]MDP8287052.1 transposase [Candidatus Electryonea clarkiae]
MSHIVHEEGHAHFLTFNCHKKLWLFKGEPFYSMFLKQVRRAREQHKFHLYAYVVMPNHVHMLLYPNGTVEISSILRTIKRPFAYHALKILSERYPELFAKLRVQHGKRIMNRFWQAGVGFDRNVFGDDILIKAIEYIHNNPVRNKLVEFPEAWKWSSAKFWIMDKPDPIGVDIPEHWRA